MNNLKGTKESSLKTKSLLKNWKNNVHFSYGKSFFSAIKYAKTPTVCMKACTRKHDGLVLFLLFVFLVAGCRVGDWKVDSSILQSHAGSSGPRPAGQELILQQDNDPEQTSRTRQEQRRQASDHGNAGLGSTGPIGEKQSVLERNFHSNI